MLRQVSADNPPEIIKTVRISTEIPPQLEILPVVKVEDFSHEIPRRKKGHSRHKNKRDNSHSLGLGISFSEHPDEPSGPEEDSIEMRDDNTNPGNDAYSTTLSALYAKLIVIFGLALPVTEILSDKIPDYLYHGFYTYLYVVSMCFVCFVYLSHQPIRKRISKLSITRRNNPANTEATTRTPHYGSFYLRVGAIIFGIGTMVYSGLEIDKQLECENYVLVLNPVVRIILLTFQMQFIFLNTTELNMDRHEIISRFGLMHMVAANLCEWFYVLLEETKHDIHNIQHHHKPVTTNLTPECSSVTMLVENSSPFLFPCTVEYSLICAVILFEMWKKVKTLTDIKICRRNTVRYNRTPKQAQQFSIDCSQAHRGMFAGILVIVVTFICLILFFVHYNSSSAIFSRSDEGSKSNDTAILNITIYEICMYVLTGSAVVAAMIKLKGLKYHNNSSDPKADSVNLDCTLLVIAQAGVYMYAMCSIMGSLYSIGDREDDDVECLVGMIAEILNLIQTSMQTLFILNAAWRKCNDAKDRRTKPGREIITFLLVANMAIWLMYTLVKVRAEFRTTYFNFFTLIGWSVITHVSIPLAIFYRFHSTICLFGIWKAGYKNKS